MVEQSCQALPVLKLFRAAYTFIPIFADYFQTVSFCVFADSFLLSWETASVYLPLT